ncbi:MAG: transporter [Candidatus Magasanikbacteria bacterium CG10_big_fil_rev_8_21_14_0_10_47_10]|uniref:Transporter n=1 Tax=Candidatus Magasanikbacteria bacterium CG10_big_fil_rev_8_21_14_0_10_47_10 TaxID=1974652 RepID=A0A2H0TR93_9BACT|nr:MAG: transporter [Candidatus Magasanikbacteria bacterium CG10_big_fil_rev_8_21_14_0_10_47_10]
MKHDTQTERATLFLNEIIGWYGTVAIITAYALLSFDFLSAKSLLYQILNATGALGIVYISFRKKAYQPGVLNIVWAVIASIALLQIIF